MFKRIRDRFVDGHGRPFGAELTAAVVAERGGNEVTCFAKCRKNEVGAGVDARAVRRTSTVVDRTRLAEGCVGCTAQDASYLKVVFGDRTRALRETNRSPQGGHVPEPHVHRTSSQRDREIPVAKAARDHRAGDVVP